MSIQTTDVACIWKYLLWFLIWLCCLYGCHCGLLFLFACLHIVIHHSIICVIFFVLICVFTSVAYLVFCDIESALLVYNSHAFIQHCRLFMLL
jgi:hypothetical protein